MSRSDILPESPEQVGAGAVRLASEHVTRIVVVFQAEQVLPQSGNDLPSEGRFIVTAPSHLRTRQYVCSAFQQGHKKGFAIGAQPSPGPKRPEVAFVSVVSATSSVLPLAVPFPRRSWPAWHRVCPGSRSSDCEFRSCGVLPRSFLGIQFGRVGRELVNLQPAMVGIERCPEVGLFVI